MRNTDEVCLVLPPGGDSDKHQRPQMSNRTDAEAAFVTETVRIYLVSYSADIVSLYLLLFLSEELLVNVHLSKA